ncbi:hypothetical protein ACIGZI_37410, partial [Streptomyces griseus]
VIWCPRPPPPSRIRIIAAHNSLAKRFILKRSVKDHSVVFDHIDRYSEPSARRLFSNQLVDQAQHLYGLGRLNLSYSTWGQS